MIILKEIEKYDYILQDILQLTTQALQERSKSDERLLELSGTAFEREVCVTLNQISLNFDFHTKFEQASSHFFPDLYAKVLENNWFGVEVKTSQGDWKCFGNSIFESLRIPNLDDRIYVFFGKFSNSSLECRWAKYDECIDNINITHSPRYQINMEVKNNTTLSVFNKMSVSYLDFHKSNTSQRMDYVRKLKKQGIGQDVALWWLPDHEETPNTLDEEKLLIKLFSSLPNSKKEEIRYSAIALFPEIFSKNGKTKYLRLPTWLASQYGVVMGNIRDLFTAGGKYDLTVDGISYKVPKVCKHLHLGVSDIKNVISNSPIDELAVKWNVDISLIPETTREKIFFWVEKVTFNLKQQNTFPTDFPLEDWLTRIYLNSHHT